MAISVVTNSICQHFEQGAFLWLLRDRAVNAPHYSLKDLSKLDGRIDAHIDGLRVAEEAGWEVCKESLSEGESGEIFAAAVLAFESGYEARIQMVLDVVEERPETCTGLVCRLGMALLAAGRDSCRETSRNGIAAASLRRPFDLRHSPTGSRKSPDRCPQGRASHNQSKGASVRR